MEIDTAQSGAAHNGSAPGSQELPVVLRPGIALPIFGCTAGSLATIAAVILAAIAHGGGKGAGMPPAGDWSAVVNRLAAGEICVVFGCGFFALGSQRIILADNAMRIVSFALTWTVGRNEVADVAVSREATTIILVDGSMIEPMMFMSLGRGASSGGPAARKILQWRHPYDPGTIDQGIVGSLAQRRISRPRAGLLSLAGLVLLVAAEAVIVTAFR
jgi:hypothetical protein